MITLQGKYNLAKVYTDNIGQKAISQILKLLDNEEWKDSKIRIMPDVHAGKGCVIGLSMTISDKVIPNFVGVDIGCGVMVSKLNDKNIDFKKLDTKLRKLIPLSIKVRKSIHENAELIPFDKVIAPFNEERARLSIGSLGGGNHFIEIDKDDLGNYYLLIHSGSRNFGNQIAQYYQKLAVKRLKDKKDNKTEIKNNLILSLKKQGKENEIQNALKEFDNENDLQSEIDRDLAYLDGEDMVNYLNDMHIAQQFAYMNRLAMSDIIINEMGFSISERFDTIHNYIDINEMILRKGAVAAYSDHQLVIPINMRDGSIIATGKSNSDWNCTAPHGAGRLFSRSKARELFNLNEFEQTMQGIYTTSVSNSTIDECPMAYKSMDEILTNINDTIDVKSIIKPLYNLKG